MEERSNTGLAIVGGALLATGATLIAVGVWQHHEERKVYEERRANDPNVVGDGDVSGGYILAVTGVILGIAGTPLLIVGLAAKPRKVLVRDSVALAPAVTPSFGGLALTGTF